MEDISQRIKEQIEKLKYLEGTKEKNLQIIEDRVREINEKKSRSQGANHQNQKFG